jgi:hypothetical protein
MADIAEIGFKIDTSDIKKGVVALDQLGESAADTAKKAGIYTDAAGKMREANGRFVTNARKAELGLDGIGDKAKKAGDELERSSGLADKHSKSADMLGKALGAAAAALAGGALVAWIENTTRGIAELDKFAKLAGTTAEEFQKVAYGATRFGVEQDKLSDILKDVNDKVGDFLSTGAGPMADFFEQIAPRVGVTAEQFKGLSGPQALGLYISSLEKANVNQQEMTFYLEALASDSTLLAPLFSNNAAALSEFTAEAESLGLILANETVVQAQEFQNSLATLGDITGNVSQRVAADMLPTLNDLTGTLIGVANETEFVSTVSDVLSGTLKGLATVAIGIGAAFKTTGAAIGAVAAAMVQAAQGDFQMAWDTIQAGSEDYSDTTEAALAKITGLWDGTAAESARKAVVVREAFTSTAGAGRIATTETVKLTDAQKAMAKASADLAKAQQSNGDVIADLAEQLYQATLSADELIQRQNRLRLTEFATPDQVAQVRSLTDALSQLKAQEDANAELDRRRSEFGNDPAATIRGDVPPLSGGAFDDQTARYEAERQAEELRYQEQQARLNEALELELITREQYANLEVEMRQVTADRIAQIEMARNDMMLTSASSAFGAMSNDLMAFAQLFGEEQSEMFAIAKAAAIAQTIIQTYQGAQQAFTSLSAIPVVGPALGVAAAAAAVAGGLARVSAISSQSPSFDGGGFTGYGSRTGGLDGKGGFMAMMHPNETVIDHTKGQQMPGGGGGQVVNNFAITGQVDRRTQAQIAAKMAQEQQRSRARFEA